MVELAAIGFALRMLPHLVWEPLPQQAKDNLAAYLTHARRFDYADNNWKFFRVLVDLGLEQCGIDFDRSLTERYLEELDGFYIGDGWYRDGNVRRIDHYIPFAMHFYGLIYARLATGDERRAAAYRERAQRFARDIRHWFDDEGGTLAFGRSLTYRFACGGFWGALAFADLEALPWGEIKGQFLRHLRWWSNLPIAHRDGVLSIGYGYPNLFMSEGYNSAGSPYWALKAFLPLALPEDHPFWTAEESAAVVDEQPVPLRHPGMVMMHTPGNVVALSSGQQNWQMRAGAEKYAKFAYASRYAFSVEVDERAYQNGAFDGALALSDDDRHFRVRETNEAARIAGDTLHAVWKPWDDVTVETWLAPAHPWHIRVHRITTPRRLHATEGGFAIARADLDADTRVDEPGRALARSRTDLSAIVDLAGEREGRAHRPYANTNLVAAKTIVPQLRGEIGRRDDRADDRGHGAARRRRGRGGARQAAPGPRPRRPRGPASRARASRSAPSSRRSGSDAAEARLRHAGRSHQVRVRRGGARPPGADLRHPPDRAARGVRERRGAQRARPDRHPGHRLGLPAGDPGRDRGGARPQAHRPRGGNGQVHPRPRRLRGRHPRHPRGRGQRRAGGRVHPRLDHLRQQARLRAARPLPRRPHPAHVLCPHERADRQLPPHGRPGRRLAHRPQGGEAPRGVRLHRPAQRPLRRPGRPDRRPASSSSISTR